MGNILSWIRGPRDGQALQDVSVEGQTQGNYRPLPLPRQNFYQSQPSQATPKPAAQVSTVKPAQFEVQVEVPSAAAKGAKEPPAPADLKPAPTPLSTDDALASLSAGFMTETVPAAPKKQEKSQTPAAAPPVSACPPVDKKPKMEVCDFSLKAGLPAELPAVTATKGGRVNVCPPVDKKAKMAGDVSVKGGQTTKVDTTPKTDGGNTMPLAALDALAGTFPKDTPKPKEPELRPEDIVSEGKHKEEDAVLVGEREDSIAPDYRFNKEELMKLPAPKPEPTVSTPEALDFLSGDFLTPTAAPAVKAPPAQKAPADKKGKKEDDFSLEAGLTSSAAKKVESSAAPPVKGKAAAGKDATAGTAPAGSMPTDVLSSLGDLLPADVPRPELPKLRPEDIVSEDKRKKKEAVRVGEREDTIAPDYRFNREELVKLPAPKTQPGVSTGQALDFLSGDFLDSSSAQAHVCPSAPPAQTKIEDLSALDQLSGDFVAPTKASGVQAPAPPSTKKTPEKTPDVLQQKQQPTKPKTDKAGSMPTDALSSLGDLLPADVARPELPKLRPEDIVSEDKHKDKEAVLVGEREDTIPEAYRFNKEELMKLPAPEPEPTIGTGEALDILSEGFLDCSSAPVVQAPVCPSAPPAQSSADFALDALADDFTSSSGASLPAETTQELTPGADTALDALSDILGDITPAPQPVPELPKNIVKEKEVVEERLIKMGERDDTLPPEYRPTEEDRKKMEEEKAKEALKPKETMDDKTALDLLSSDFSDKPTAPGACSVPMTKLEPPVLDSEPLKPMAGGVLDSLSGTLLPDVPEFKSKTDKPKGKSKSKSKSKKQHAEDPSAATDQLPAQPSSDVVPKSTKKGGRS